MRLNRLRTSVVLAMTAALLLAVCTAGDDDSAGGSDSTDSTEASAAPATGPSPGVTDDTIKVGITYVDTASLVASGLNYDLGDYEGAYNVLIDQINEDGGINGRQIEPVYGPIDPTNPAPAEEQCVKLTEDEDVFVVVGFFLTDAVTCPVDVHETAVVGGEMTTQRLEQAKAPWVTWTPDGDQPAAVIGALSDEGALDGNVAVFSNARDQDTLDNVVLPALEDLGIEPVEVGIVDAPADDQAAVTDDVQTIAQAFEAADADTVIGVGLSAQDWPTAMADDDSYRPTLAFLDVTGGRAFATNDATTDTSVLDGALAGGPYGPAQAVYEEEAMQDCIATIEDAGIEVPAPEDVGEDPSNQPFQAAFFACPDVALMKAVLEAAGDDLNYGTLEAGFDGLEVHIPGDPETRTYGPAPDLDGDPAAYLFQWDEDAQEFVPIV